MPSWGSVYLRSWLDFSWILTSVLLSDFSFDNNTHRWPLSTTSCLHMHWPKFVIRGGSQQISHFLVETAHLRKWLILNRFLACENQIDVTIDELFRWCMWPCSVPPVITSAGAQTKWMCHQRPCHQHQPTQPAVMEPWACNIIIPCGSTIITGFLRYSSSTFDIIINVFLFQRNSKHKTRGLK